MMFVLLSALIACTEADGVGPPATSALSLNTILHHLMNRIGLVKEFSPSDPPKKVPEYFLKPFVHYFHPRWKFTGYANDSKIPIQLARVIQTYCGTLTNCTMCAKRYGCSQFSGSVGRKLKFVASTAALTAQCTQILAYAGGASALGNDLIANQALFYTVCDPGWAISLVGGAGPNPFRTAPNMSSYVYPLPESPLNKSVIAIIGDWGTGMPQSFDLLNQIMTNFKPNAVLHLGDVYYRGAPQEQHDYQVAPAINVISKGIKYFTIPGNHDYYYQMGAPFFAAIDNITAASNGTQNQEASFFSLEGSNWVLLGMDTGLSDSNVNLVDVEMPYLGPNQASWAIDKIQKAKAGGKRVIFSTHHQFFTQCSVTGQNADGSYPAVNPLLASELSEVIPNIDIWFWGHEHSLEVYPSYAGLQRGRMLGSSAVTTITSQTPSNPNPSLVIPPGETVLPSPLPGSPTSMPLASFSWYYQKQFAIMTLQGDKATVDYYSVDWDCNNSNPLKKNYGTCWSYPASLIYTESF